MNETEHALMLAAGQHIVAGLAGEVLDEAFKELVRTNKIGNVLLRAHNIRDCRQLQRLCADLRELIGRETSREPLIILDGDASICVDSAGMPSPLALAATADPTNAYTVGTLLGSQLREAGINATCAPTLDLHGSRNRFSDMRSVFSDNAETAASFGSAFLKGLEASRVLGIARHFPGQGDADRDPNACLSTVHRTTEELWEHELVPFIAAIRGGLEAIMLSPTIFAAIEESPIPASLSHRVVRDLLRDRMGYQQLICSADLTSEAISCGRDVGQAAVEALRAGADLAFIGVGETQAGIAAKVIADSLGNGHIAWEDHERSLARIDGTKLRYASAGQPNHLPVGREEHEHIARAIMERAICIGHLPDGRLPVLGDHPLFIGCGSASSAESFATWMESSFGGTGSTVPEDPDSETIIRLLELTKGKTSVVIATNDGHAREGQLALANSMAGTGLPIAVFALGSPADLFYLAQNIWSFAAFCDSPLAYEAIARILRGERSATGMLPIRR